MRALLAIPTMFLLAGNLRGQERSTAPIASEEYTINEFAITRQQPVSFSIGYPKGWRCMDNRLPESDMMVRDSAMVCSFWSNTAPWPHVIIWRAGRGTAKDDAEVYARRVSQASNPLHPVSVHTTAGDTGYLVVTEKKSKTLSDFFFHVGIKGNIRISIISEAKDSVVCEELKNLFLQTLRF
jgi:hypothetical protein